MRRKLKYIILTIALIFLGFQTYAQIAEKGPPEPTKQAENNRRPCGVGDGGSSSPRIPPPVGLCLPINDYLLPLLIVGIAFGGYKVWRMEIAE